MIGPARAVTLAAPGRSVTQATKLSFDSEEMILADERGELTKDRRYTGPLPAWTQW